MTVIQENGVPSGNSWGAILNSFLSERRSAILERWVDEVLSTYQPDSSNFIKKNQNRFANPVGHTLTDSLVNIFDALRANSGTGDMTEFLDNIIRIRAVQDFPPSGAVSFMFTLKDVIRDETAKDPKTCLPIEDLAALDKTIDCLALVSFDIFMKCREKLYDIKANELKKMTYRLLERANMVCGKGFDASAPAAQDDVDNIKQEEVTK
ncbi:MAG: RsbRD N-terminal domain-containing protein [Nitrospirae bacterium]|nr:RsbRD N-terminal domain-containing protein [Nitrospirota bacterium]